MGRTIVTDHDSERKLQEAVEKIRADAQRGMVAGSPTPRAETPDSYRDRLLKYIPAEIVAIYLALGGLLKTAPPERTPIQTIEWVVFWIILGVTVPWQIKILKITKWQQVAVGTVAFVFWAVSLGDPFQTTWKAWYQPLYGSMALMLYTFLIPLFEPESVARGT